MLNVADMRGANTAKDLFLYRTILRAVIDLSVCNHRVRLGCVIIYRHKDKGRMCHDMHDRHHKTVYFEISSACLSPKSFLESDSQERRPKVKQLKR